MNGQYPAVSINGSKVHVHRLIMSFSLNRKLFSREYCHHINGNKLDSSLSNIELMSASRHQSDHNSGKKLSKIHREKISKSNRDRVKHTRRNYVDVETVMILFAEGNSISYISKKMQIPWSTVNHNIKKHSR